MPATLSPKGTKLLGYLPPFVAHADAIQSAIDPLAREAQRLEDTGAAIRYEMFPKNATDRFRFLSLWEHMLGFPVAPDGVSLAARRNKVLAHMRKRGDSSGLAWEEAMQTALASIGWRYEEGPDAYMLRVHVPYDPESYTVGVLVALMEAITPAHLLISVSFNEGFLVGISRIGIDPL